MFHPYGDASTRAARGRRAPAGSTRVVVRARVSTSPSSIARPAPRTTEPWRFAQRTRSGRTSSVRLRTPRRAASTSSQSDAGEERERGRLRAERPAPRAGEDREEADHEGRARRRAAGPRGREREAEREQDEGDPEEDHGAHAREPVGGVEDDLGEPLLVGPRAPLAEDGQVLGVRQAVLDDLASGHQRQPRVAHDDRRREDREEDDSDQADEEDREGARLEGAADSAPGNRLDTCRLHVVLGGWCPTEVGHRWGSGAAPRAHERIFARGSARLSGPRARVARDPCGWPVTSPITMLRA